MPEQVWPRAHDRNGDRVMHLKDIKGLTDVDLHAWSWCLKETDNHNAPPKAPLSGLSPGKANRGQRFPNVAAASLVSTR